MGSPPSCPAAPGPQQIPGFAALNAGGNAEVNGLSCGSAGDCTAAGYYGPDTVGSGDRTGFLADESDGTR